MRRADNLLQENKLKHFSEGYRDERQNDYGDQTGIESLNRSLHKVIKTKGAFPNDAAILKIFYLAPANIARKWTLPIRDWKAALSQFAIRFAGRFEL